MRKLAVLAIFLALEGCVSVPALHLPHMGTKATPAPLPAPAQPVCSITLTAAIPPEPKLTPGADLPSAETTEMSAAEAVYFSWLHDFAAWAHGLQASLSQAQKDCASQPSSPQ